MNSSGAGGATSAATRCERPRVALINDTSLYESHFGCELVAQTFREQFARTGLELVCALPREFDLAAMRERLEAVDLVVINGEGSLHHGKRRHLLDLAGEFPSVLVNTVWQDNPPHPSLGTLAYVSARESASGAALRDAGVGCDVTPDVIFASSALRAFPRGEPSQALGITDSVKRQRVGLGPLRIRRRHGFSPMGKTVGEYLALLCAHERLCIGRFHAVIAASVLGIPFSCWRSNTWKIDALTADMGVPGLCHATFEAARANVPDTLDPRISAFAGAARARVEAMFDRIAIVARARRDER